MAAVEPRLSTRPGFLPGFTARSARLWSVTKEALKIPTASVGVVLIVGMLAVAFLAPLITDPNVPNAYQMPRDWGALNQPPGTPGHLLGTTDSGGDVLYGLIWGARTSLRLSIIVVAITVVVGLVVGSFAGFLGGKVDTVLMRIVDVFLSVPS
jgi:peptide/nickel transport system permease protein